MSKNSVGVISAEVDKVNPVLAEHIQRIEKNNDSNRAAIWQISLTEGAAFLGKINLSKNESADNILTLYKGQQIFNSDFDFCIPAFDRLIIEFIEEWNASHQMCTINAIYKRIEILRGSILLWM